MTFPLVSRTVLAAAWATQASGGSLEQAEETYALYGAAGQRFAEPRGNNMFLPVVFGCLS